MSCPAEKNQKIANEKGSTGKVSPKAKTNAFPLLPLASVMDATILEARDPAETDEKRKDMQRWRVNLLRARPEDPHSITAMIERENYREIPGPKHTVHSIGNRNQWIMVGPEEFSRLPRKVIQAAHRQYERAVRQGGNQALIEGRKRQTPAELWPMVDLAASCQDEVEFQELLTEKFQVDYDSFKREYAKQSPKWLSTFQMARPSLTWLMCEILKVSAEISEKTTDLQFALIGAASRALIDEAVVDGEERSPSAREIMHRFWHELPPEIQNILFPPSVEAERQAIEHFEKILVTRDLEAGRPVSSDLVSKFPDLSIAYGM